MNHRNRTSRRRGSTASIRRLVARRPTALGVALAVAICALASSRPACAADAASAQIDSGRWENGYGIKFFNVVGTVKNDTAKPLAAVQVRVELVDASGKVVKSADMWNAAAEGLADAAPDAARGKLKELHAPPIAPGASDKFRASFLEDETPKFDRQQVHVIAALPVE